MAQRAEWRAEALGYLLGPPVLAGIAYPFVHAIGAGGAVVGVLAGGWIGELVDRRMAARRVAEAGGGVTVIPLDSITGVRTRSGGLLGGRSLVVTTQDGTEYRFHGRLDTWQADLAAALTVRGRSVRVTPEGIMVTPPPASATRLAAILRSASSPIHPPARTPTTAPPAPIAWTNG